MAYYGALNKTHHGEDTSNEDAAVDAANAHNDPHHIRHCFDYLRQALMVCCNLCLLVHGFVLKLTNFTSALQIRILSRLIGNWEALLVGGSKGNVAIMIKSSNGQKDGEFILRRILVDIM